MVKTKCHSRFTVQTALQEVGFKYLVRIGNEEMANKSYHFFPCIAWTYEVHVRKTVQVE
jgi:hypothetical protein